MHVASHILNQNFEWMFLVLATYRFAYHPTALFIQKLVTLIFVVYILKHTVRRWRPNRKDRLSFPSGHSALAWFLAWESQNPLIMAWAAMVSWARVKDHYHWWSDVIAGSAIAYFINFFFER